MAAPQGPVCNIRLLTLLEGLSLRAAGLQLGISAMAVSHREVRRAALYAQKKAVAALRLHLVGGG